MFFSNQAAIFVWILAAMSLVLSGLAFITDTFPPSAPVVFVEWCWRFCVLAILLEILGSASKNSVS